MTYTQADKNRLRWRSRRGLLELDIVFEQFLEYDFDLLSPADLDVYQDLLMLPDIDLLELVDGKAETTDKRLAPILERLRHWQVVKTQ
ncbi:FAD assembly factor SdhE [Chitinimonas sp. BJB300]|uniref:FAD assembly factor SdhE n=1 Tax=Chitinimonas sp. BJB300 TaxID=1559339 RepID=UPI000C11B91E|nr:succinate dehydrogenase assembly factor 2 [Chitinimonas sp. BJB300]PHV13276.1 succinate dehydrogenase assembly factor 2 [Chitinimonas sp. BJB300]TSJ86020.1 succinate dehydrogenase assembly factor 2 family protein [Chitinimonas sp. BJB300]